MNLTEYEWGWTAVSFFTVGTGYSKEITRFIRTAMEAGIKWTVYERPNLGSWRANLNFKSEVIRQAMDDHPGRDIVWVDADGAFLSYPTLFDELSKCRAYDIAFHRFKESRIEPGRELLSGTLWVANTERGRRIVDAWHTYAKAHPEIRHQKALDCVLRAEPGLARVFALPIEYCAIYDHPAAKKTHPVIVHYQASRRLRSAVRGRPTTPARPITPADILTTRGRQ